MLLPKLRGGFFEPSYVFFKAFPIRSINFADPAEKAQYDKMVALVEQMLELHKRLQATQTANDRQPNQRQMDETDDAIDDLVYQLYELGEDEIAIVKTWR